MGRLTNLMISVLQEESCTSEHLFWHFHEDGHVDFPNNVLPKAYVLYFHIFHQKRVLNRL